MPFYELGVASVAAATNASYQTIHGTTAAAAEIMEYGAFCNAATASPFLMGRPANTPVATTSVALNAMNDADVGPVSTVDSAWSTAPTTPTVVFRRVALPATIAAGIVFVWNQGEGVRLSKTAGSNQWIVIWNYSGSTGSVLNTYWKIRE